MSDSHYSIVSAGISEPEVGALHKALPVPRVIFIARRKVHVSSGHYAWPNFLIAHFGFYFVACELGNSDLKIAGFGACMISGYPHKTGGLFEIACARVEKRLGRTVISKLVSLDGFTAPRAEKHLPRRMRSFGPDYVVIQFGSSDAHCPVPMVRRKSASSGLISSTRELELAYHSQPSGLISSLRWEIVSLLGHLLKIDPETALPEYVAVIERMATLCISQRATPVVLSPFVFGSRYSTRSAIAFTRGLRKQLTRLHGVLLVDCVSALGAFAKPSVLQRDGIHLSQLGHLVVGEAIAAAIASDALARSHAE
jgi:lysophospholipase L1-like esterase